MREQRGKDDGPPRLEDLAGRLLGSVLDLGWAVWTTAREAADFSLRAVRAAADVLLDASLPRAGHPGDEPKAPTDRVPDRAGPPVAAPGQPPPASTEIAGHPSDRDRNLLRAGDGPDPFAPPLPMDDGRDRLVAVERDPATLFAWWDVSTAVRERARAEIGGGATPGGEEPRLVLRVDIAGEPTREIDLPAFATGGYVERPGDDVSVDLVLGLVRGRRFAKLAGPVTVAGRSVSSPAVGDTWRRVGVSAVAGAAGVVPSPPDAPSPEASHRLAALAAGIPATGSPPWTVERRRGPLRGPGGSGSSS